MTTEDGVWVLVDRDYGETVTAVYPDEISALRVVNNRGYGRVQFLAFGKELRDE